MDPRRIVANRAAPGPELADPVVVADALVARLRNPASPPPPWFAYLVDLVAAGQPLYLYQPP